MEMCPASWVMSWSIEDSTLILIFLRKLDKIMCFWEKTVIMKYHSLAVKNANIQESKANSRISILSRDLADLLSWSQRLHEQWGPAGCRWVPRECEGSAPTKGVWQLVLRIPRIPPGKKCLTPDSSQLDRNQRRLWETLVSQNNPKEKVSPPFKRVVF